MKIQSIELVNFRGITHMPLVFTTQTTALVGVNGVGKSSVLDALAIALSNFTERMMNQPAKAQSISPNDIRLGADYARLVVTADLGDDSPTVWAMALNRKAGVHPVERSSDFRALNKSNRACEHAVTLMFPEDDELIELPLPVYYDVHRAVLDVPLRTRGTQKAAPEDAYSHALEHGGTDFRGFFTWFRSQEDAENELIRDDPQYRDRGLTAVRRAIEQFTQFTDVRIRRKPTLRMTVKKAGTELNVMQLSDGERCLLALVGDLARRLSLLNTKGEDPLSGAGVVLIDEIDLHLHPLWQRTVVASLERTFPNCQFIITTHSPQILGEMKPNEILLFRPEGTSHPQVSYGLDSGQVLAELMGTSARSQAVEQALSSLFTALERNELDVARAQLHGLKILAPGIAELGGAQALLKRKEILGR